MFKVIVRYLKLENDLKASLKKLARIILYFFAVSLVVTSVNRQKIHSNYAQLFVSILLYVTVVYEEALSPNAQIYVFQ